MMPDLSSSASDLGPATDPSADGRQELSDAANLPRFNVDRDPAAAVSVIITTYNHARFLGDAIQSALSQTVNPIEVIVVDDGSTDNPTAVLAGYPNVHLIRQTNRGLAAARNAGWRAARGKYIMFVDADDRLLPNAIASNLRRFSKFPNCAFVFGSYRWIDVLGRPLKDAEPAPDVDDDAYAVLLEGNCIGMHATVLYRRDRLEETGGFDEGLRACEDYDVYLRLARQYRIASGSECLAEYRRHDTNMSGDLPLMLGSALAVLRRQRSQLGADPRWRTAYKRGIRDWQLFYAERYLHHARIGVARSENRWMLMRDGYRVFRLAPIALPRAALGSAYIRLRRAVKRLCNRTRRVAPHKVRFGDLRRTTPISSAFGYDRGKPVDRHYIETFLARYADDVRGRVLEIGDNAYTRRFGGTRVSQSDVLHVAEGNPHATFVGDLANGDCLPGNAFDCIVFTQTLQLIYDMPRAVETLHRILRPGGVLLATVPGVSSVDRGEWGDSWYWSLTQAALRRLLEERFSQAGVEVVSYGNVLTAAAFLYGMAENELRPSEFEACDPRYPVIVAARAVKEAKHDAAQLTAV